MKSFLLRLFFRILSFGAALGFLVLVLGPVLFTKSLQFGALAAAGEGAQPPAEAVAEARVERFSWERSLSAVGTIAPIEGATLQAEVSGLVQEILFRNGQAVRAGDPLVKIDSRVERAELAAAEAAAELARVQFRRTENLVASNSAPQSNLDLARAEVRQAEAQVENIEARLERRLIRAPFDGVAGIRQVNAGQFVNVGTPLVTVQNTDSVFVDFELPQRHLARLRDGLVIEVSPNTGGEGEVLRGLLSAVDPLIDPRSRAIRLQGTLENEAGTLRSGMFVRVRVLEERPREVLAVPLTAIISAPYGDSVFLISVADNGDLTAEQKFVRTGERRGDFVEIVGGLEAGERIVGAGAFKLRNNSRIVISDLPGASPSLAPNVPNS